MNSKKIAVISLFFAFVFLFPVKAFAFVEDHRYYVRSSSLVVRRAVGIMRHEFKSGFSGDLSSFKIKVARMFGGEVVPLKPLFISAIGDGSDSSLALPIGKSFGGKGVSIAVLDTGISKHKDLVNRIAVCQDFTLSRISESSCEDRNGHGTHVAGILAADGGPDDGGLFGVAPESSLLIFKVCSDGGKCFPDDVAKAIDEAVSKGANIVLMGFGSDSSSELIDDAITRGVKNNVLFVAAAGNNGPYSETIDFPASHEDVIPVGASDRNKNLAEWSSRGVDGLDFVAPGDRIQSAWLKGEYKTLSGTSMAAPVIAGQAARVWHSLKGNPKAIRSVLTEHDF